MGRREELERELKRRKAVFSLPDFLDYTDPNYDRQWFHTLIATKCQQLLLGKLPTNNLMLFTPPQHGKALSDTTLVPTPKGFVKHGALKRGDLVFGRDGSPVKIIATSKKVRMQYVVTFNDGTSIECHGNHEWEVFDHERNSIEIYETKRLFTELQERGIFTKYSGEYRYSVEPLKCAEFAPSALLLDAYTLGEWIGVGYASENATYIIPCSETAIIRKIQKCYRIQEIATESLCYDPTCRKFRIVGIDGVLNPKHIPRGYIYNSEATRKELIAGLIDSAGVVCRDTGRVTFNLPNKDVLDSVALVLRSLGQDLTIINKKEHKEGQEINSCHDAYTITFFPVTEFPTVVKGKEVRRRRYSKRRTIVKIEKKDGLGIGKCIQVEGGVYLVGMNFIPTHNSEIVSRKFPAWTLGYNPRLKIVGASYSKDLALSFSRAIQRIIDSEEYREVFPATFLNSKNVVTNARSAYLRNTSIFETVGYSGFYKPVGVCGSLTGTAADLGIIDDPIKNKSEAYSLTYRNAVWAWYNFVFKTRVHNNSKTILIMTRWHEDDLAGRILKSEPKKWSVITIPAVREDMNMVEDPRQIGEALWESQHSLKTMKSIEEETPRLFASLYQQRPSVASGNIVKEAWFNIIQEKEFKRRYNGEPIVFFLDTAYTDKTDNDPTGIIATCKIENDIYITNAKKVYMKFPELIRFIPTYVSENGYSKRSSIRIEPKANGLSVIDQLKETTGLNVVKTPTPKDSKETRLYAASPTIESGRIFLVEGIWNEAFTTEVCGFPSMPHDEYVDVLYYAIDYYNTDIQGGIDLRRIQNRI